MNVNGKIKRKALIEAKGEYLDWIRRYAETEIKKLKEDRISDSVMNKFLSISFEELAKSAIENQRKTTNSEKYVDDNWSRFSTYTPQYMKDMRALDIEPCDLSHVLSSINKKDSQRKNLRSLYNYIYSWAYIKTKNAEFLRIVYRLRDEEIEIYQPKCYLFDNSIEILKERDFDSLFDILKKEKKHRQKADFILLMFHLRAGAKPIKLLRAKWDEFLFLKLQNGKTEYVWCPKRNTEKSAMLGRCKLDKTVYNLLIDIKQRNNKKFLESDFVFPSNKSWITGHMATQQSGFGQV